MATTKEKTNTKILRHKIDVRDLNLEQKRKIWAHFWRPNKGEETRIYRRAEDDGIVYNIDENDTIIYVYEDGSGFPGNIARDGGFSPWHYPKDEAAAAKEHYADCVKPIFESVPVTSYVEEFKGLADEYITRRGRRYKLVLEEA